MVVVICAWCKEKIKLQNMWQTLACSTQLDKMIDDNHVISHGVCPECCASMHQDMAQMLVDEETSIVM